MADFINPSTKKWNAQELKRYVSDQDVKAIVSIPISKFDLSDKLIWHYSKRGTYLVKSGYQIARKVVASNSTPSSSYQPHPSLWIKIWNLKIPPKVKHFWWRACRNMLATKENLFKRKCSWLPCCPVCNKEVESIEHIIFQCKKVNYVWNICKMPEVFKWDVSSILQWTNEAMESLGKHVQDQ